MTKHVVETITGALVLLLAIWCGYVFINKATNVNLADSDYILKAKFENVDGIEQGSAIRIAGVKVGIILTKELDPNSYFAIVKMAINKDIKLPIDTVAKISSDGLLGAKFMVIIPGAEEKLLEENEEIKYTQSSVNLENLVGKMIFSKEEKKEN